MNIERNMRDIVTLVAHSRQDAIVIVMRISDLFKVTRGGHGVRVGVLDVGEDIYLSADEATEMAYALLKYATKARNYTLSVSGSQHQSRLRSGPQAWEAAWSFASGRPWGIPIDEETSP